MSKSGKQILNLFLKKGWNILRQKGSHVQIGKVVNGKMLNQTIPMHKELKKGLIKKLLKYISD